MKHLLAILSALVLVAGCQSQNKTEESKAPETPKVRLIIDDAYTLMDDKKLMKMFYDFNKRMLEEFDVDFRVISTTTKEDIDLYANRKFNEMQRQSRSKSGKALLLVVNPAQDKVRLEVSQALEPVYTDAFVSYIERKGFVPYFRDFKVADGVYAAMELIRDRAYEAAQGKEFMPPMQSKSIGGGAKSEAHIGQSDSEAKRGAMVGAESGDSPEDVMNKYLQALKAHNRNPDLEIYSKATREFFRKWTVTTINQDHEVDSLSQCPGGEVLYGPDGLHAVLAHRPYDKQRKCAPYFFKKEEGKWRIDIATMARSIRFNADMQWHFDLNKRLEGEGIYYAFAFDGFGFDKNGYPFTPKQDGNLPQGMRWGFQCGAWYKPSEKELYKQDPKRYARCWIRNVYYGMPAEVRLGLDVHDYVVGVGEGPEARAANYVTFMEYMKQVPSGSVASVTVLRYDKKNKRQYKIVRRGIAP